MTERTELHADVPHEAAQIINQLIGSMSMAGLTGQQAAVLFQSISTVMKALEPKAE